MRTLALTSLLVFLASCGGSENGYGSWRDRNRNEEDYALPVRVEKPSRNEVEDYVETQANLESDLHVDILAEVEAQVVELVRDVGDRVGVENNGGDPFLLARLDDRDLSLALKDSEIRYQEAQGSLRELELELQRNTRLLEQSKVQLDEAAAVHKRTSSGITDGTISMEEHETATFGLNRARSAMYVTQAAKEKAEVALGLGKIAVDKAAVARDRAKIALERTRVVAPFAGTVTACHIEQGEWVTRGMLVFRVEDLSTLVALADLPVRQAARVKEGDVVLVDSTATPGSTRGKVLLVEPTVNSASGTVRAKIKVEPQPGFKPGLFVNLRIVVETRRDALVVPKRSVMHDDEEGAYLFVIEKDTAKRLLVDTGFEREDMVEIVKGVDEGAQVVVEGQDTLTDGAKVEIKQG